MALADTARLIASLELQDKFSRPIAGANRSLSGFERNVGSATRATRGLGVAGTAVGTAMGILGARLVSAGIRGLAGAIQGGVAALNELENVTVATNTVLTSTRGVSGQTAESIRDLAEEMENLNASIDDKVIQSAENMLLTFTNVRSEAFEPALEAILDMNEAMGGGEEGLQNTVIQVGRALNDPIRGLTALRRVGVAFTDDQKEQIRVLQESGDLYGAQQIILAELSTEFGGRFAAAGRTAAGSQAALRDRIEDVQKALAGPLIPVIDRVRAKLIDLLGSPRVLAGAEKLGEAIANLFTDENIEAGVALIERGIDSLTTGDFSGVTGNLGSIAESIGNLPWGAIGDAARLLGTGSKALLDAFLALPPWVQTAVLTGWGLNKLTGGALTSIVGTLASGLVRGILGINAGVVNVNGAVVNSGGVPGAGGSFGRSVARGAAVGTAIASVPLAGVAAVEVVGFEQMRTEQRERLQGILDELPRGPDEIGSSLERLNAEINKERGLLDGILFNTNVRPQLEKERQELINLGRTFNTAMAKETAATDGVRNATERVKGATEGVRNATVMAKDATNRVAATVAQNGANQLAKQQAIANAVNTNTGVLQSKNFAPKIKVDTHVTSNVTISEIQRKITSQQIATSVATGGGGFAV